MSKLVTTTAGQTVEIDQDCRGRDLTRLNLAGMELRDYDFRGADLSNADFHGSLLINCRFDDPATDITSCNFSDARILGGHFEYARAQSSVWRGVTAQRVPFDGADLTDADFSMGTSGRRSNLFASSFQDAVLCRTSFMGAILRNTSASASTVVEEIVTAGADLFECGLLRGASAAQVH